MSLESKQRLLAAQTTILYALEAKTAEELGRKVTQVCTNTFPEEPWPTWLQPLPEVNFNISKRQELDWNLGTALRGFLHSFLVLDPILYSSQSFHPASMEHLHQSVLLIGKLLVLAKQGHASMTEELWEIMPALVAVYKVYLHRLAVNIEKSYGNDSLFYKAVRYRYGEEMRPVQIGDDGDLPSPLTNNKSKKMFKSEQAKLMRWAGIANGGIKV